MESRPMTKEDAPAQEFDSPWKEAMETFFEEFMLFFFPVIHAAVDWSKGYVSLDKELEKIVRDAELGKRIADKLVKVFLKNGEEAWLLIHIEVQGYYDKKFNKRMFVYHYRIFDRHEVEVVSLAVLSDDDPNYRPSEYRTERWGCKLHFQFPTVKVLDHGKDWDKLELDPNPFTLVVMAHLKSREVKDGRERKRWKFHLIRLLYERGYEKKDILGLFRFIDWLLVLPDFLEVEFKEEILQLEDKKMPYITSIERLGRKTGMILTAREMVLKAIEIKFKMIPEDMKSAVENISVKETLDSLLGLAITSDDLNSFRKAASETHGI